MPRPFRKPLRAALWRLKSKAGEIGASGGPGLKYPYPPLEHYVFTSELKLNLQQLEEIFNQSGDVVKRDFFIGGRARAAIIYVDGLADKTLIEDTLLRTLQRAPADLAQALVDKTAPLDRLLEIIVPMADVDFVEKMPDVVNHVLNGDAVLLFEGYHKGLATSTRSWEHRSVSEPLTESVVRGPREGFVENLRTNTALIRRRLKTPDLVVENLLVGRYSQTNVSLAYLKSLVNPALLQEVRRRLDSIDVDGILESAYIEELIEDNPFSPFPQIDHTERPDKVAAALLEGRVAILLDNTPFALLVPTLFVQFLQASEDYYERYWLASFLRLVRFVILNIALLLPSAYVAVSTFHQEMLPTNLLVRLAAQREGIPFPALVEALLVELVFEILREAGVRLPRLVGQAVSIVGALVIGEAAVSAGLFSPAMVIVVALTGISSFALPKFSMAITIRLLRFIMLVLAGVLGFYGIMLGLLAVLVHLTTLRSFGVPYLAPVAPYHGRDYKDVFVRAPRWAQDSRPTELVYRDPRRQTEGLKPAPPGRDKGEPGGGR
ncbi:spore germination protein [Thermanaeromonas sp. C210]|uniref:spore germination protein n=1 Tax=Thermanaeromonas sp. C210 TaxID=2731925 RepID=UPI00155BB52F|nr:spore germination protein [Thermanaeromonas sp. C210]GFN22199.1 spore germination protein [Thermanaeromonas sp. C210]